MTLLEALVVVAITAMIGAIGWPAMHAGETARALRSQSAALAADLKRAHAAAVHLDRPVSLAADTDGGGWRWDGGALRVDPAIRVRSDPAGPVVFYPDGSANGSVLTIGTATHPVRLTVDGPTGTVVTSNR